MEQIFEGNLEINSGKYKKHTYYEAPLVGITSDDRLLFHLGDKKGIMKMEDFSMLPATKGMMISMIGQKLGFYIVSECTSYYTLSRKAVQEQYIKEVVSKYEAGDIVTGRIKNITASYCFVELGYGYTALLLLENACVAHINSLNQLFKPGMELKVLIKKPLNNQYKLAISLKELLGDWKDNYTELEGNESILGYVTRVTDYGAYVLLRPNFFGLTSERAVTQFDIKAGDTLVCQIAKVKEEASKVVIKPIKNKGSMPELDSYFALNYYIDDKTFVPVWKYSNLKTY